LHSLLRRADEQTGWTRALRAILPQEIGRECRVVDIRGPVLVIGCRSAATATRLRFTTTEIIADLQGLADFSGVSEIRLKITSG